MVVANLSQSNVSEQEVATGAKEVAAFEAELSKVRDNVIHIRLLLYFVELTELKTDLRFWR